MRSILLLAMAAPFAIAQTPQNYDEAKVPAYTLPDPLRMSNGQRVTDAKTWETRRRPEIVALFESEMHGRAPAAPKDLNFELAGVEKGALGGRAVRKQITLEMGRPVTMLLYVPAGAQGPVPVVLGLNFGGNHTVTSDAGIALPEVWAADRQTRKYAKRRAEESSRGSDAARWQVEKILAHGFAFATMYYQEIEPDFDGGMQYGIRPKYFKPGQSAPAADEWGAIAAWAWGLSRGLDYLEKDPAVDAKRVAVMGHSRLGKTALWAGASDPRFALVISNDSGEGGAAISRRKFGETVENLNTHFPHWFCANYRKYSDREEAMPFDSNLLLSLMAPRPLYVASAEEDRGADPKGEFLAAAATEPVYRLFGKRSIGTEAMPAIHEPVGDTVRYHIRAGKHSVTEYDWDRYLEFIDRQFKAR